MCIRDRSRFSVPFQYFNSTNSPQYILCVISAGDSTLAIQDSELLIESVIEYFPDVTKTYNFLDLGSGSGCLIISLLNEYLLSSGTGVEIDKKAIKVSEKNKEFL